MSDAVAGGSGADGRVVAPDRLVEIVAESVADVVRAEVRAVRGQLVGALRPAGVGFVLLGTAGACAVLGVGAASTTVLRMLESFLPKKLAAAGMTAGYLAAAAVLGRLGLNQLHAAGGGSARLADRVDGAVAETASWVLPAGATAGRRSPR
ncbi:phage holin family protein [Micromonospora globbae]|uniref:phage holin family protein n=1 Tax=Micromonospora globbae TaxID=1894969 RepID=UPI003448110D